MATSKTTKREGQSPSKQPAKVETESSRSGNSSPASQREIEFRFKSPSASFVKLAADFTDWQEQPIQMVRLEDGTWLTSVPLRPGSYAYRFIVDGDWADDPGCEYHAPNPFGTQNSVIRVP